MHGKRDGALRWTGYGGFAQDCDKSIAGNGNGRFGGSAGLGRVPRSVARGAIGLVVGRRRHGSFSRVETPTNRKGKLRAGRLPVTLAAKGSTSGYNGNRHGHAVDECGKGNLSPGNSGRPR